MATAVHLRFDAHARFAPHIQCAYAFRAIGFVAGQTHQINWQSRHIDRHAACGLRSIHMKNDAALAADFAYRRDVLNHADFVVHKHDRSQNRIGAQSRFKDFQVQQAIFLHIKVSDFKTLALQFTHGVEHSFVLGFNGDEVLALGFVELGSALDRQIV